MAFGTLLFRVVRMPALRERLWKLAYETFPRVLPDADWWFMNYGYEPSAADRKEFGTLDETQFQWRSRAMYHYLAARSSPAGKDLLEVGSGRGGGLRHLATTMAPKSSTGLDFARSAIDFCHRSHKGIPVTYLEGDGMNMPFEDLRFDLVLNVESCHAYLDQAKFIAEVRRVLRPGGRLYLVDVRSLENWVLLRQWILDEGFTIEEDAVVPRAELPKLIKGVKEIAASNGFKVVCYGHAGDGNLHIRINHPTIKNSYNNPEMTQALMPLFELIARLGGTISGEHGVGLIQKPFLKTVFSETHLRLMRSIKQTFDPNNILNAGKIFD